MYDSHFTFIVHFLPQGITVDYYSNLKTILGNTGKIYRVVSIFEDKEEANLPFNKLFFRIL